MKLLGAVILALSLSGVAIAVEEKDLAACASLEGDLTRLSCFDELVRAAALDGPQPQPVLNATPGKWRVSKDINPMDDSERVVLRLTADSGNSKWDRPVTFVALCQSVETKAYIDWDDYLGNDGGVRNQFKNVTIRIGSEPATTQQWDLSTDSKATFAPGWAGNLLRRMASTDKFIAQVVPYNESPVTAIFDTAGMADALEPLMEVCEWSL